MSPSERQKIKKEKRLTSLQSLDMTLYYFFFNFLYMLVINLKENSFDFWFCRGCIHEYFVMINEHIFMLEIIKRFRLIFDNLDSSTKAYVLFQSLFESSLMNKHLNR